MPLQQGLPSYADQPFDPSLHRPGTKGRSGKCTLPGCEEPPVTSRHWDNPSYEDGWWGAYCSQHAADHAD
jgi:hypothetical protein